jgi:penicillin-binding protein 1A
LLLKIVKFFVVLALLGGLGLAAAAGWVYFGLLPELPSIERLEDVRLQVPLRIYAKDGALLAEFGEKRRRPLAIEDTPDTLVNAFLAAEDDRFYEHPGVDYQGIARAALTLATTGKKEQGGSTITMQVARNFFLTPEKTYIRKLKEILLALQIEQRLSKEEILELYLNKIYLGNRAYGVAAAAQIYYGKATEQLTLAESAMVAGLPKAPSRYNPLADAARALVRRNYVLDRMLSLEFIGAQEHTLARAAPITAKRNLVQGAVDAQYVAEMVRAQIIDMFGEEEGYTGGYKVYTTVATRLQAAANVAVRNGLFGYEERHGYRGAAVKLVNPPAPAADETPPVTTLSEELVAEARAKLATYPGYEPAEPAVVTQVDNGVALLQNATGEPRKLALEQLAWAKRRLDDQGTLGPAPTTVHEVLAIGDLVYVTPLADGGWRLVQLPEVEGALVALDPKNGAVRALVGGFSFERSKFNRAVQAFRQPGSNFKPFIYSAALENGFTAATLINDAPVVFDDPALEGVWRPENYSGKFYGPTRLREALIKSRNLVSVRVLISLGVGRALRYAQNFGFRREQLPRDLSLVLGSGSVSPMELARAYSVFANGGYLTVPYFIERIEDGEGNVVFTSQHLTVCPDCPDSVAVPEAAGEGAEPVAGSEEDAVDPELAGAGETDPDELRIRPAPRVINKRNAFIMRTILQDVVRLGTGRRARVLKRGDIAGKTGTTNDQRDTWFSGFNSTLAATSWVGFDSQIPLGAKETGARAALPAWVDFMRVGLDGVIEDKIERPDGLVTALIDRKTGDVTSAENPQRMFEIFREEHAPKIKPVMTSAPDSSNVPGSDTQQTSPEQLF